MKRAIERSIILAATMGAIAPIASAQRTITADVVALDQAFYNNRLGAFQAGGMIFALRRDVVNNMNPAGPLTAGHVMLRPDKRARPIVLRMNVGDCLQVDFENLLASVPSVGTGAAAPFKPDNLQTQPDPDPANSLTSQPATRMAGVHVMGMELKQGIDDDASWIGGNPSSLAAPGEKKTYRFCAVAEGGFLLYSTGANIGYQDGFGGQLMQGLFGSVTVQPEKAEWYRSQVTRTDLDMATYQDGALPGGMTLTATNQTFTKSGKTYKVWKLKKVGPGGFTSEVTQTNLAGDPVNQGGLLKTRDLQPVVNYQAAYPPGAKYPSGANIPPGTPILAMLDKNNSIVHSDLTAIITGPNAGRFPDKDPDPVFLPNPSYPNRHEPYREFAIHYHDDPVVTQAFAEFQGLDTPACEAANTCGVTFALQAARDFFAINYGIASVGPEVWANRIGVGPMTQCATCKFEEFFLSSWSVGDPAMIVDNPANINAGVLPANRKTATKAFYPDDPSNVYHSYMGDHVEFRILHAGANITHVHHQHAHQWLHSPNSDESDYRDSQMLSPGGAYTLDMAYFGSGNLNQTVGDSIFHCHFYPHFAQGMWSLWRVHDVFEEGTKILPDGRADPDWNRALPDGEIANGTPIPAIVPMPTLAMAPMPIRTRVCPVLGATDYVQFSGNACPSGTPTIGYRSLVSQADLSDATIKEKNPGFPFYVPGIGGQRPVHPPLDLAPEEDANGNQIVIAGKKQFLDGGLPRSQVLQEQGTAYEQHNAWDFTKENDSLLAVEVDQEGTNVEQVAMGAHAVRKHPSFTPEGHPANFILNGQKPKPGAPFADPAIDIEGKPIPDSDCSKHEKGCTRYKAADIQLDVVLNKKGWHFPQQRILSLWGDVKPTLDGTSDRRPEPFFFRANSDQVIEYWLANLVPTNYELDDFQVRTPTDVIGQHIHLVKFDVTSSDGAGNGFNYEDGTFSNEEVVGLIGAINKNGGLFSTNASQRNMLKAKEIPYFAMQMPGKFPGAQATVQRWYADPIWNCKNAKPGKGPLPCKVDEDRTLRTVFTHDHFGPSTHQQVGLYAGLVIEPKGSKWFDSTTGVQLGGRAEGDHDGGPTTFQANINLPDPTKSYREFLLEFQDRQLAYYSNSTSTPKPYKHYTTDPGGFWGWADPNNAINAPATTAPNLIPGGPPTPDLITNQMFEGTFSLNYANEPLPYRVASGNAVQTDLSNVFRSIPRGDPQLNGQPAKNTPINMGSAFKYSAPPTGAGANDPYTPLLRAYEGDNVQIRNLVGAHMAPHSFHIHGLNWQFEPSLSSSGFRSTQGMGLSEHYEFLFRMPVAPYQADYLYIPTSDTVGIQYGNWGLLRGFKQKQADLVPLSETQAKAFPKGKPIPPAGPVEDACPMMAPSRTIRVSAVVASAARQNPQGIVYNARGDTITDPNALMYVRTDDLDNMGHLKPGVPIEPLIARAVAGECIHVELTNRFPMTGPGTPPGNGQAGITSPGQPLIPIQTSPAIGLHPQLLHYDMTISDGFNVGANPVSQGSNLVNTAQPGETVNYTWYAGRVTRDSKGKPIYTPVEFGAISLAPSDPLMQDGYGMVGALIIEPVGLDWETDDNSRASANLFRPAQGNKPKEFVFREAVAIVQDDFLTPDMNGKMAFNYRTEPFTYRYLAGGDALINSPALSPLGISRFLSDTLVSADPQTPVFAAEAGKALRLRVLHPAGLNEEVFELHGHAWQEEPYSKGSTGIVANNPLSQWTGSRDTFGANSAFDVVLRSAGGANAVPGDYLFRTFIGKDFQNGMWGLLRVGDPGKDIVTVTSYCGPSASPGTVFTVTGRNTVNPSNHHMAQTVTITGGGLNIPPVAVNAMTGEWSFTSNTISALPAIINVTSTEGGQRSAPVMCQIQQVAPQALLPQSRPRQRGTEDLDRFRTKAPVARPR
jgi:hypothetical protein